MANELYTAAKEDFLTGNLNLSSNTIKIILVDNAVYTQATAHTSLADVPDVAKVATANLTNTSVTGGVFDADDVTFTAVTGANCEALIIYHDKSADGYANSTMRLIAYIDTATGLPILPNGGDITVRFSSANTKIFAL
jgi:hypothetical protein